MEAFGQLAGGVAHDFNNFLTTILGYSDLLLAENAVRGPLASHLGEIRDAAERAATLTNQLLAFSRRQALEPTVLEVNSLISNLERSLLRLLGENIAIECRLHHFREGAHAQADAGQLTQILINLAVNARDAMPRGGCLTIETSVARIRPGEEPACASGDFQPGEYVIIALTDNGSGMTDEVKAPSTKNAFRKDFSPAPKRFSSSRTRSAYVTSPSASCASSATTCSKPPMATTRNV